MYLPQVFCETDLAKLIKVMQQNPLATLITQDANAKVQVDLLPFLIADPTLTTLQQLRLVAHISKNNPLCSYADGAEATVLFYGASGYISPNYYPSKHIHHRHVPTWNYQVVELRGRIHAFDDAKSLMAHVGQLSKIHESSQPLPWRLKDAPTDYLQAMIAGIIGLVIEPASIVGKFKLSQNREPADCVNVINELAAHNPALAHAVADAQSDGS